MAGRQIWMINQYAAAPGMGGGSRNYDLAQELTALGFEVVVFAAKRPPVGEVSRREAAGVSQVERYGRVSFVWIAAPAYSRNDWRRVWNMLVFACKVLAVATRYPGRPVSVMASSPSPLAAIAGWAVARLKRARYVLEVMDLWPECLVDMGLREWSIGVKCLRLVERFLYSVADKIVILAAGARSYLAAKGVPPEKICYNPNGVLMKSFRDRGSSGRERTEARRKYGFTRFTVVYTGAHGPANSLDTILRAAAILQDSTDSVGIVLVGSGPAKDDLMAMADQLRLENVRFMDPIAHSEIPRLLLAADAGVITLLNIRTFAYGVSPNKLFEYMAAGLPVLCAIPGELQDLVVSNGAGMKVEPQNAVSLASAILTLQSMPDEKRVEMGRRGRELVETHFSRKILARELVAVLDASSRMS